MQLLFCSRYKGEGRPVQGSGVLLKATELIAQTPVLESIGSRLGAELPRLNILGKSPKSPKPPVKNRNKHGRGCHGDWMSRSILRVQPSVCSSEISQ